MYIIRYGWERNEMWPTLIGFSFFSLGGRPLFLAVFFSSSPSSASSFVSLTTFGF